ncbi:hypothetical protein KAT59_04280, partial [Candidatus Bipolaricaulota bacterium]|nr:hypothetical protein [Candidatus Bipolaricaulota bacterium]
IHHSRFAACYPLIPNPHYSSPLPSHLRFTIDPSPLLNHLPQDLYIILSNMLICRYDRHAFHLRLSDENSVKWISMMLRKHIHVKCMRHLDGQRFNRIDSQLLLIAISQPLAALKNSSLSPSAITVRARGIAGHHL